MESTSNISHVWKSLLLALSKHGHVEDPLSAFQKKMSIVKVAQNGNGLSLGGFTETEIRSTKESPTNPQCQATFVFALIRLSYL